MCAKYLTTKANTHTRKLQRLILLLSIPHTHNTKERLTTSAHTDTHVTSLIIVSLSVMAKYLLCADRMVVLYHVLLLLLLSKFTSVVCVCVCVCVGFS